MSYTTAMSSTSGNVINEFSNIDTLLEGTDDEKEKALQLLQEMYSNVSVICVNFTIVRGIEEKQRNVYCYPKNPDS